MRTTKSWWLVLVLFALSVSFVAVPKSGIVFYDSLGNVCCFHEDNQEIEKIDFQKADKDTQVKRVFVHETCIYDLEDLMINAVKAGFLSNHEILEECMEMLEYEYEIEDVTEEDVLDVIIQARKEYANVGEQQVYHQIDKAFKQMSKRGIVALHCAGYAQDDGFADCAEIACEWRENGQDVLGCCFYTMQGLERILDEQADLYLSFGSYKDEMDAVTIGRMILEELKAAGFEVEWNGTENTKIAVKHIIWDKQYSSIED